MKLIKTQLRNLLAETTLKNLSQYQPKPQVTFRLMDMNTFLIHNPNMRVKL